MWSTHFLLQKNVVAAHSSQRTANLLSLKTGVRWACLEGSVWSLQMTEHLVLWEDTERELHNCCDCHNLQLCSAGGIIHLHSSYNWQCKDMGAFGPCSLFCSISAFRQNHLVPYPFFLMCLNPSVQVLCFSVYSNVSDPQVVSAPLSSSYANCTASLFW